MSNTTNKPAETLRDGSIKAVIWANQAEKGLRYSVELTRSYQDSSGNWQNTPYLSNGEILRGSRLLQLAYDQILQMKSVERSTTAA